MWLDPSVSYRPTEVLVALFSWTGNPRASHAAGSRTSLTWYADVVRGAMEGGGPNRGARDDAANRGNRRANGQASMICHSGFQHSTFHLGYRGDYGGHGRGRYNGGDRYREMDLVA